MKTKFKILLVLLCFIIAFCCVTLINKKISYAWETNNLTTSNLVINEGILNSIDLHFDVPDYLAETTSWVGLQTKQFNAGNQAENDYGDLTDYGTVYQKDFADSNAVLNDDAFCNEWGIEGFNSEGFPCFGAYSSINTTISGLNIDLKNNQKFYVYLWTSYKQHFYPDALIAVFEITDGELVVTESKPKKIEKIEIEDANLALKVDEKPAFNAKIKDNEYNIKLAQTLISTPDRWSTISTDDPDNDMDVFVRNLKYDYIIEITNEDTENFELDENVKIFVNGEEFTDFSFVDQNIIYVYIEDGIIPEGYIEPATLDEDFEEEQIKSVEEQVLKDVKSGKVVYKDYYDCTAEETKEAIEEALQNGDEISVVIYVSKALPRSLIKYYFEDGEICDIDNQLGENLKFGADYCIEIEVYVNGYNVGFISKIETPVQVTVPLPNGLPKVADGYERVWKIIRNHKGTITVLDAKLTENGISFISDRFSEFVLVYEDMKLNETGEEINEQENTEGATNSETAKYDEVKNETSSNPTTGDNILTWIFLLIFSALGILRTMIFTKAKRK